MRLIRLSLAALALAAAPAVLTAQTATPIPATPADATAGGAFVMSLSDQAFAVIRDKSLSKPQVRAKFRTMLRANFDIPQIGAKLVRSHRAEMTSAQAQQYLAIFPDYVVGTYADRLYEYGSSTLKLVRTQPKGTRGDVDVFTRLTLNGGNRPIDAIWTVRRVAPGKFLIENLTVGGVNLSLTQEADFSAYIARNGFDALLQFMKTNAAK